MDDLQDLKQDAARLPDRTEEDFRRLRDRIVAQLRDEPAGRQPRRSWLNLPKRIWVPAIAGVLTIGLILGVVLVQNTASSPQPADTEQPSFLDQAADSLDSQAADPLTVPTLDQWRYSKVARQFYDVHGETEPVQEIEGWLRVDYQLAAQDQGGEIVTHDSEGSGVAETDLFTDLPELYTFLRDLPDEPSAVIEELYTFVDEHDLAVGVQGERSAREAAAKQPWSRQGAAFDLIRQLLYLADPPPDVQAKLFRALDEIPGTYEDGTVKDFTGTEVVVIAWKPPFDSHPDIRWTTTVQILIDANTYTYRGHRGLDQEGMGNDKNPLGIDLTEIRLDYGIVNRPGQLP